MSNVVGLSGGIGSGKTTVARMLEKLGAVIIDADAIVHELQAQGQPLVDEIAAAFGPEVLDAKGALDRVALGDIVFRDAEARQRLDQLVHPRVGAEMLRRLAEAREANPPVIILDIPLLFEGRKAGAGAAAGMDFRTTILVWVPRQLQIERQIRRDGYGRAEAERRVSSQMPLDEKRALADHVIDNSGSLEETERQVQELYASLTSD